MANRCGGLLTGAVVIFFGLMAATPIAWGVDLTVRPSSKPNTSVTDILNGTASQENQIQTISVEVLSTKPVQTLEYRPQPAPVVTAPVAALPVVPQTTVPVAIEPTQRVIKIYPTFAVFPVLDHRLKDKAFSDLPIMFSTAVANQLADKLYHQGMQFNVLNPMYAYDTLKDKGMETLYNKMVEDYRQAGRPNEKDLATIADQLSTKTQHVDWIVFATAEFDMNHLTKPKGFEIPMKLLYGSQPSGPNYFVKGSVQIYSTQDGAPLLWDQSKESRLTASDFGNFTVSVFDDSDSSNSFKKATSQVATALVAQIPETTYQNHSNIQVTLLEHPANTQPSEADQQAFQQIINYH